VDNQIKLQKYLQQLIMLSRLRNLEAETKKQVEDMPITYDIKKDGLYLEGKKIGEKRAEKRAEKLIFQMIEKLLQKGLPIAEVSEISSLPDAEIEKIAKKVNRKK
jgi:hypothetical protein